MVIPRRSPTANIDFQQLPKVELHLHLDCSMSYQAVKQIDPSISEEDYLSLFVAPARNKDLAEFITYADQEIALMQTEERLRIVTLDLIDQLKQDQVVYAEIRFAPLLHLQEGLSPEAVVEVVDAAVTLGMERSGVKVGLILATLRHYSEAQSLTTVKLVEQYQDRNVVGFDIAADEAGFPITHHVSAFRYAQAKGLNITAHAGEAKGAESLWETLDNFAPTRIGHGVRCVEDPALMAHLKAQDIHLEVCPTSNLQTNVFSKMSEHTIDQIYQYGISMGISTDTRTISNTTLSQEYERVVEQFAWTKADLLKCNLEAIDKAFADAETKEKVRQVLIEAYR